MGNCCYPASSSINRVSSNAKSESPKIKSPSVVKEEEEVERRKLPSNPEEVEDFCRDFAANSLIAFTFDELKDITENFRKDCVLGGGGFGCVYKGLIAEGFRKGMQSLEVAVKVHDGDKSFQGHREWLAEVIFLGQLSHPNLVELVGYCCENEHRVLVYRFMAGGSVEASLFSKVLCPLPWAIRVKIAFGAAKGLAFLHEAKKPVIFRDFKTANVLLDLEYNAKLSDFGLAKDGPVGDDSHVSTRIMGTYGYAAPEYMMTGKLLLNHHEQYYCFICSFSQASELWNVVREHHISPKELHSFLCPHMVNRLHDKGQYITMYLLHNEGICDIVRYKLGQFESVPFRTYQYMHDSNVLKLELT